MELYKQVGGDGVLSCEPYSGDGDECTLIGVGCMALDGERITLTKKQAKCLGDQLLSISQNKKMKTDDELKAEAFDAYMMAADEGRDVSSEIGRAWISSSTTLSAIFSAKKAAECMKELDKPIVTSLPERTEILPPFHKRAK